MNVMCVAIRKLLAPNGRKYVKILLLEFLNEDHILHFFLLCKDFFDKMHGE